MRKTISLDDIRRDIEREYAPVPVEAGGEVFELTLLLRTDKEVREAVVDRLKSIQAAADGDNVPEDEVLSAVRFVLESVESRGRGAVLYELLRGDLLVAIKLLEKWTAATQPGEAKDSPTS